ncbi:VOC family protein [Fulvivirga sp. M361]|uniref:VOC family protein n=1 Tax=Fulvivirga sp. M361 TaxID=2594266 RepID=UPI00117A5BC1|nr:VOC family protein [Fulvivirga sp. M361]TRX58459.1 VOC family protein [Fulvivirga sp. M361]
MANAINWFELPVADLERAKSFYETILDIEISLTEMGPSKMGWFPGGPDQSGATGTLMKSEGYKPSHDGTLVYFSVQDIEGTLGKIGASGGETLVPKTSIGDYGFIAHFQDTEGNRVALHSIK